jgi:hypothetical protein
MNFWERALVLFDAAVWIPVGVGVFGRLALFDRGQNVLDRTSDPSPLPSDVSFPLRNDEPERDDPNFVLYDDRPVR